MICFSFQSVYPGDSMADRYATGSLPLLFFLRFKHDRYDKKKEKTLVSHPSLNFFRKNWVQAHLPKSNFASRRTHSRSRQSPRTKTTNRGIGTARVCARKTAQGG